MALSDLAQQQQRAVRNRPFTAAFVFGLDGDSLPDSATTVAVTVTNAEGVLVASGTATLSTGPGPVTATFALTGAQLPNRDLYTCAWTATVNAVAETQYSTVDVCDGRLFPLSDYTQYPELTLRGFSDAQLEQQRYLAEDFLERECGRAFTGRYGTEHFVIGADHRTGANSWGWGSSWGYGPAIRNRGIGALPLRREHIQTIRGITRNYVDDTGTPQTYSVNLAWAVLDTFSSTIHYQPDRSSNQWDGLWGDLTIDYEHGGPVMDVRRVCAILARHRLLKGPLDDRATQISGEGGGIINLLTPGVLGSVTGIPDVDVFLQRYNARSTGLFSGL